MLRFGGWKTSFEAGTPHLGLACMGGDITREQCDKLCKTQGRRAPWKSLNRKNSNWQSASSDFTSGLELDPDNRVSYLCHYTLCWRSG